MWTSRQWAAHFAANADELIDIPWHLGVGATPEELAEVVPSLRAWQLGETSEGKHLLAAAAAHAEKVGDPAYVEATRRFIAEEQRHGETLGRYLDLAGVERARRDWGDTLFRAARYCLTSMEAWATPVVMVEVHAMVFYHAVLRATRCPVLRRVCAQLLRDEVPHIRFQCERLAELHRGRPAWLLALTMAGHRLMFAAVTLLIWAGHRRAYRAGGYTFASFWLASRERMRRAWRLMSPRRHHRGAAFATGCLARPAAQEDPPWTTASSWAASSTSSSCGRTRQSPSRWSRPAASWRAAPWA